MPSNYNTNQQTKGTLASLRALVPNRQLTQNETRQVTERQASALRRILGQSDPHLNLEAIAAIPRIGLIARPDLPTSATAFWDGTNWVVLVNTAETITRQRFSICHELHHIICYTTKQQMFANSDPRNPDAERLADHFAASLLMPKLLVKRHWGQGPRTVSSLARRFGVSPQAMSVRLDQLGLTDPKPRCAWNPDTITKSHLWEIAA